MGKTHSKPLAVRHGRGTVWGAAWERHAICESALRIYAKHCYKDYTNFRLITRRWTYSTDVSSTKCATIVDFVNTQNESEMKDERRNRT